MFLPLLEFKILHSTVSFETISYVKARFAGACLRNIGSNPYAFLPDKE
jgi:hypothetical protein